MLLPCFKLVQGSENRDRCDITSAIGDHNGQIVWRLSTISRFNACFLRARWYSPSSLACWVSTRNETQRPETSKRHTTNPLNHSDWCCGRAFDRASMERLLPCRRGLLLLMFHAVSPSLHECDTSAGRVYRFVEVASVGFAFAWSLVVLAADEAQ